jgi:chromosome segregation ATPase
MSKTIGLYVLLFVLTGCATTTDPRQGGLFSYSPQAYEQRLGERRNTLEALQKNAEDQQRLEREAEEKRQVLAEQQQQLVALDTELAAVHQRLAVYEAQNQRQSAEKTRLERAIRQAETRLDALRKETRARPDGVEERQAQKQQLQADIEKLSKALNLLMQSAQ